MKKLTDFELPLHIDGNSDCCDIEDNNKKFIGSIIVGDENLAKEMIDKINDEQQQILIITGAYSIPPNTPKVIVIVPPPVTEKFNEEQSTREGKQLGSFLMEYISLWTLTEMVRTIKNNPRI